MRQWRGDYRTVCCPKCGEDVITQCPRQVYCSPRCLNAACALRHYYRHRERILADRREERAKPVRDVVAEPLRKVVAEPAGGVA
jgi:endogenous inhibitor of DNA gyrase (YacG/DUF329 family)